jgi:hypothetical protein
MEWAGHVSKIGKERSMYRVLVVKYDGKRSMGRPRCRWEYHIKMDLQVVGCWGMD